MSRPRESSPRLPLWNHEAGEGFNDQVFDPMVFKKCVGATHMIFRLCKLEAAGTRGPPAC